MLQTAKKSVECFLFELKRVSKSYPSTNGSCIRVLKDVSLSVAPGDFFGLIGLSGAGKSTMLRVFNLLEVPDEGRIFFQKREVSAKHASELRLTRQKVGMIFQQFNLLSNKTVSQNIALPLKIAGWRRDEIEERVEECLQLVGLQEKIHSYPNQLSGGQKQRVAIARSIANRPSLLLADEPTSALDPITKKDILDCLQEINRKLGLTVVITTHEMNVIRRVCNQVAVLDSGVVREVLTVRDREIHPTTDIGKMLLEIA